MKRRIVVVGLVLSLLSGCFNQPQGFRVSEPGGYNFTTGNQRDRYNYERYSEGKLAVHITLRMVELPGEIYEPRFDVNAFLERIGWTEAALISQPLLYPNDDFSILTMSVRDANDESVTIWVINLNSPVDVWAEVRGHPQAVEQAFIDWEAVWDSLEFIYF